MLDGVENAGPHVRNACQRHFDDLAQAHERGFFWDDAKAHKVMRFFEERLKLNDGQFDGKPFKLHASQAFKLGSIFGWVKPSFDWLHGQFDNLITKMLVVIKTAQDAGRAMQLAYPVGVPDEAKATSSANDPYIVQRKKENEAAADFEKKATRRAGLTKTQLELETKLADVRKRLQSEGVTKPDEDMVRRIADAELAGEKARSAEGKKPKKEKATPKSTDQKIDSDIQAVKDRTEALRLEAEMVGKSTAEQEKRRISMDLEQAALAKLKDEAIKAGKTHLSNIKISADQRAQIDQVANIFLGERP